MVYLLKEFEESPQKIWESNIFGKSLHELVNEGLHNKLYRMPADARLKLQETVERIINEGCAALSASSCSCGGFTESVGNGNIKKQPLEESGCFCHPGICIFV